MGNCLSASLSPASDEDKKEVYVVSNDLPQPVVEQQPIAIQSTADARAIFFAPLMEGKQNGTIEGEKKCVMDYVDACPTMLTDHQDAMNEGGRSPNILAHIESALATSFLADDTDEQSDVRLMDFLDKLEEAGLRIDDPRLSEIDDELRTERIERSKIDRETTISQEVFKRIIHDDCVLVTKAIRKQLIVPDWNLFCDDVGKIFDKIGAEPNDGTLADYIPELANADPSWYAVSVCSIDGQRHSWGDAKKPFCLQSSSKPFTYAVAVSELGREFVHKYVGTEPSGRIFNELCLDHENKPHNPLINAGAILTSSMPKREDSHGERFEHMQQQFRDIAGGEFIGFDQPTFRSERSTADRNFALAYTMREKGCFVERPTDVSDLLDFYFELCSIEVTCESLAVMGATLANGGVCPITDKQVLTTSATQHTLSLMYSCGMYDYSGMFSFNIGLPAKSGVSGCLVLIVPNVCAFAIWSPPLDRYGNTVRGVRFCEELVNTFGWHEYDNLRHSKTRRIDPTKPLVENNAQLVTSLMQAANTDYRLYLQGISLDAQNVDGRTALHISACEGHVNCVRYILRQKGGEGVAAIKDRYGRTALDDARHFENAECVTLLEGVAPSS